MSRSVAPAPVMRMQAWRREALSASIDTTQSGPRTIRNGPIRGFLIGILLQDNSVSKQAA